MVCITATSFLLRAVASCIMMSEAKFFLAIFLFLSSSSADEVVNIHFSKETQMNVSFFFTFFYACDASNVFLSFNVLLICNRS
jgi:hypothetical protein